MHWTGRLTIVLLISGLLAEPAAGQHKAIDLSLFGGVNVANLDMAPDPEPASEDLVGFTGGAGLCFNIRSGLSLEIQGLYVGKGARLEGNDSETETHLKYIAVSPLLRIAPSLRHSGFYLLAGAEFGFLLDATNVLDGNVISSSSNEHNIKDSLRDTDFGVCAGLGLQFGGEGQVAFALEGRYVLGLTNILDTGTEEVGIPEDAIHPEWKTQGIYVFAGLRL